MRTFRAALLYFLVVFGVGFLLGAIRVWLLVPRIGSRVAELAEVPIMIAVTVLAARWVVRWLKVPSALASRLGVGGVGLLIMLVAEFGLVLWVRGLTIRQYLETRDPISGTAYYLALLLFALMPALVARK